MQAIDAHPNGYTAAEILSQLQFETGSRELSFRYDLHDYTNTFKQPLTNVVSCSVQDSFLSDIKRTAQFEFVEDGTINFVSDRIKPWVQVVMPSDDRSYVGYVASLMPVNSWTLNETTGLTAFDSAGTSNGSIGSTAVTLGAAGIAEGSSYGFNGSTATSGYVSVPSGLAGVTGDNGFTIVLWVRVLTASAMSILKTANASMALSLLANGSLVYSQVNVNNTVSVTAAGTTNPIGSACVVIRWTAGSYPLVSVNGSNLTNSAVTGADVVSAPLFAGTTLQVGNGFTGNIDDLSLYAQYLTDTEILDLYRAGVMTGPFGTKNYAEWPQGIFLLSSTERDNDQNGVVTRSVDGYDQLQVYTDDKVTNRYTVPIGASYTNTVVSLLQQSVNPVLNRINSAYDWVPTNASLTSVDQASSTLNGATSVTGTIGEILTSRKYSIQDLSWISNVTVPSTGAGHRNIIKAFAFDTSDFVAFEWIGSSGTGTLIATQIVNGTSINSASVAYNATTHAFWMMSESGGIVTWATSPDGITWTTLLTATLAAQYYQQPGQALYEAGATGNESAWSVTIQSATVSGSTVTYMGPTMRLATIMKQFTPSASTLTAEKDYDPGTSKLAIINDLLSAINYTSLSFDPDGYPVVQPYVIPASRAVEFTYSDDNKSVIMPQLTETLDLFDIPNVWVLVVSNPDQTMIMSTYTNNNPLSITSTVARGRTIVYYETEQDAPDQPTLDARAKQEANDASQVYDTVTLNTPIMPFHDDNDVIELVYNDLGISDKFSETTWQFDFQSGATMQHTIRRQVQLI